MKKVKKLAVSLLAVGLVGTAVIGTISHPVVASADTLYDIYYKEWYDLDSPQNKTLGIIDTALSSENTGEKFGNKVTVYTADSYKKFLNKTGKWGNTRSASSVYWRITSAEYKKGSAEAKKALAEVKQIYAFLKSAADVLVVKGSSTTTKPTTPSKPVAASSIIFYKVAVKGSWTSLKKNSQTAGTTGKTKQVTGLRVSLNTGTKGVTYRVHQQGKGWLAYVKDGQTSGASSSSKRVEAIQVKLTGETAKKYNVEYRTHVQKQGWTGWSKNGATSGTTGKGAAIEAVQIRLVKK